MPGTAIALQLPYTLDETGLDLGTADDREWPYKTELERAVEGMLKARIPPTTTKEVAVGEATGSSWSQFSKNVFSKFMERLTETWTCETELARTISLIGQLGTPFSERLAKRIEKLWTIAKEDEPEGCGISSGSLRNFYRFFALHQQIRYPDISLTIDGNIYAQWRSDSGAILGIQFMEGLDARFVLFAHNPEHPERINRLSGADTSDRVFEALDQDYHLSHWINQ